MQAEAAFDHAAHVNGQDQSGKYISNARPDWVRGTLQGGADLPQVHEPTQQETDTGKHNNTRGQIVSLQSVDANIAQAQDHMTAELQNKSPSEQPENASAVCGKQGGDIPSGKRQNTGWQRLFCCVSRKAACVLLVQYAM